jgi:FixJ family two-component response regulator
MSGYGREEVLSRGLVPSGRRFIQKPFTATELADAVGHALAASEPRGRTVTA